MYRCLSSMKIEKTFCLCLFISPFVCYQTYEQDTLKTDEPIFAAIWHKSSLRQGQETISLAVRR